MKKILAFCAFIIAFSACTQFSSDYKKTKSENDSLKLQMKKSEVEMNDMLSLLNAIEDDIQSIRKAEDFLSVQKDTELSVSRREQISNNMSLITETLKKNKQQLAELQNRLNKSDVQSAALQKTIDRLTNDINEKSKTIIKLQSELGQRDEQIKDLSTQVEGLNDNVQVLEGINLSQSETINTQDKVMNIVYYCFGTKKELKEQNILSGGGLFSKSKALEGEFNKEYFISVDKRMVREIPLYASKAKIRTNHPNGAYSFVKDEDGNLILNIDNVNNFWSLSLYLVIEVG
jgi:predicted  nucleic acid-binding Zn-ribbon protein